MLENESGGRYSKAEVIRLSGLAKSHESRVKTLEAKKSVLERSFRAQQTAAEMLDRYVDARR
jgi:hypothetical protein